VAVDLAVTGYILDDQTLMAAAERHMPDSCSALRIIMRCPYPATFAAYADEIIELASLSVKAALHRDAIQRLETSIISPTAPVDINELFRQIHFTSVAAADWSRAMDGLLMDDCLLQLYLARALPVSYAPLRITLSRIASSNFGDYCAGLIALASVDTVRLGRGLSALSANSTDAFDFLRGLRSASQTLPSPPLLTSLPPQCVAVTVAAVAVTADATVAVTADATVADAAVTTAADATAVANAAVTDVAAAGIAITATRVAAAAICSGRRSRQRHCCCCCQCHHHRRHSY
jgi:hypothetical protein